jgi:hypothetical protein
MPPMADIVDPPEFTRGRPPKYPWDEWTDGQWRHARRGVDYTSRDSTFQNTLYVHGHRFGLQAQTRATDTGVTFRFIPLKGGSS